MKRLGKKEIRNIAIDKKTCNHICYVYYVIKSIIYRESNMGEIRTCKIKIQTVVIRNYVGNIFSNIVANRKNILHRTNSRNNSQSKIYFNSFVTV